jgi:cytochrome c oxidase subunit III
MGAGRVSMPETQTEPVLEHQFDDLEQQHDTTNLGMWGFLATEIMFFGGLFTAYVVFRSIYPVGFARGSQHLDLRLGGINTAVLLGSSLTMALAVRAAQLGRRAAAVMFLSATMVLGATFLGLKAVEYHHEFVARLVPGLDFTGGAGEERGFEMFFVLYFFMTGLHALHMVIGLALLGVMATLLGRGWFSGGGISQVEVTGLYWHFIDIVWVFLYPLLYLIDVHR